MKPQTFPDFVFQIALGENYIRWFRHSFKEAFVPLGKHISNREFRPSSFGTRELTPALRCVMVIETARMSLQFHTLK